MHTMNWSFFFNCFPIALSGLYVTLFVSIVAFVFTMILSTLFSLIRYFKVPLLSQLCSLIISFFRATPFIAQLFFIYFGLKTIIPIMRGMSPTSVLILSLTLNTTAYMSENFRAAIEAVDKGQFEAAYAMGLTHVQTMRRVVLPQALKVAMPAIGNNFIMMVKGASMGFTIGVLDILSKAKIEASLSGNFFEAYLAVMLIYWVVILIFERIEQLIEKQIHA